MFPAPTTTASSVPASCTATISSLIATTVFGSIPYSRSPRSASPESLSKARRNGVPLAALASCATSSVLVLMGKSLAHERGGMRGRRGAPCPQRGPVEGVWGKTRSVLSAKRTSGRGLGKDAKRLVREADQWGGAGGRREEGGGGARRGGVAGGGGGRGGGGPGAGGGARKACAARTGRFP